MKISKKTEYAILGLVELCQNKEPVSAKTLAQKFGFSEEMEKKVFQTLKKNGIVKSVSGIGGGFSLAQPASKISLLDIISIFESTQLNTCSGGSQCPHEKICGLAGVWQKIQNNFDDAFQNLTLDQLI